MARPQKEGLDYFPHDVNIDQDSKVIMVTVVYGMEGYGTFMRLLEQIYKEKGYYTTWTDRDAMIFKSRVNVSVEVVKGVVEECLNGGFFDSVMYERHNILTSVGIQKRYVEVAKRRKEMVINSDYNLLGESTQKTVNYDNNLVNVNINPINVGSMLTEGTQSKVKESKVNNKDIKDIGKSADIPKLTKFIIPTIEQIYDYCKDRNNNVDPHKYIDHYTSNGWMVGKNKMKDWKAAVRTWEKTSYPKHEVAKSKLDEKVSLLQNRRKMRSELNELRSSGQVLGDLFGSLPEHANE